MRAKSTIALSIAAGFALGAVAIHGLQAATVRPTYVVVEADEITDPAGFKQGYIEKGPAAVVEAKLADGRYLARTEKITGLDGTPPKFFVIISFQSAEKAKMYHDNMAKAVESRKSTAKSRAFLVEGL